MSLAAVVTALRAVVDGVTGIDGCYPRVPETPPAGTVFAVIEPPTGEIQSQASDLDRIEYRVNVYVMTKRAGANWTEEDTIYPFVDSIPAAIRSAFTLGGIVLGTRYDSPAWEKVEAQIKDTNYIGILFHLLYKQKATVTFSG